MRFEFDPAKSIANKAKHGVDFIEVQALWQDENRVDVPARTRGEPRCATLGKLGGDVWIAIWTPRGDGVRMISARRAHAKEREIYEG